MKTIKHITIFLAAVLIIGCGQERKVNNTFKVEYHGALKNMMHKGDISAKTEMSILKNVEHLYALGAIENLKGEIQIFDSKVFNTMVNDNALVFDNSLEKKATLLVYASVKKWKSFSIPNEIVSYQELEEYIAKVAEQNQIDSDEPFPFLIEGKPKSFDWHVINWKEGDMEHSHEKHISSGLNDTAYNKEVKMLGFYSNSHHAIFTHHTTNMHIHVKTKDNKIAGHVDDLSLSEGMILKLPDME